MSNEQQADDIAFLREAFHSLADRRLRKPALLLASLLALAKIALLLSLPTARNRDHLPYLLAFMLMTLALLAVVAAILRILNRSTRPPWEPDSALWLYAAALLASSFVILAAGFVVDDRTDHLSGLAGAALDTALLAPFAPWFVAMAVERPLAWRPGPWLTGFREWLPSLLLWGLLILVPLRHVQLILNWQFLVSGSDMFWPAVSLDAVLGAAIELVYAALASTAYRRVARS